MPRERADHPQDELDRDTILAYGRTFIPREDQYPMQLADGRYVSVKSTLHPDLLIAHLKGMITLGAYALSPDSTANWVCLDADTDDHWERLRHISGFLRKRAVPSYLEPSRRGGHLWLFIPTLSGQDARRFGQQIAANFRMEQLEVYPKQAALKTGPGSFVRLPLGKHRLTGHRYHFVTPDGEPIAPTVREQVAVLANPERVPEAYIAKVLSYAPKPKDSALTPPFTPKPVPARKRGKWQLQTGTPSERIKATISVAAFVGQYVELDAQGRGHCPFHDDEHRSFGVNSEGNYWHCFAGCGGGSIIDFWMKWREHNGEVGSFKAAIKDLAVRLLE